MSVQVWRNLIGAVLLAFVGSCAPSGANVDEGPFLDALGFNRPVSLVVQLYQPTDTDGYLKSDGFGNLISSLVASGYLSIVPISTQSPWWIYRVDEGAVQGQFLTIQIGSREITGRSDSRSWTEGSVDYFAETISYVVKRPARLKTLAPGDFGPFSLRLVLANNPAVGHWQVFNLVDNGASSSLGQESPDISKGISQSGQAHWQELQNKIRVARTTAFSQIEQTLASSGVLARSPLSKYVLISTKNNLAYYIKPKSFQTITPGEVKAYCGGLRIDGFGQWRVPGHEMSTMSQYIYQLTDVPDGRLWGEIMARPPTGIVAFLTTSVGGGPYTIYDNPKFSDADVSWGIWGLDSRGNFSGGVGATMLHGTPNGDLDDYRAQRDANIIEYRVICITNIPNQAGVNYGPDP